MDFRIRQLQCFLVLSEKLHYGQAARSQFMTQPTLSFQIKSLEEDFGARLFDRSHKGVKLTPAGEHLALSARRILDEIDSVQKQITGIAAQMPLRVCCSQAGQFEVLPKVMRKLAETSPLLQMEVQQTIPEERVRALTQGSVDVLMMVAPVEATGVTFQLLRREKMLAVLPDTAQNRRRQSISVREFAQSPLLLPSEKECSYCKQFALGMLQRFGLSPETVEGPLNIYYSFAMVAAGKGVGMASESVLNLHSPGVLFVPFEEAIPRNKLGIAWRTGDNSPALRLFHEALVDIAFRRSTDMEMDSMPVFAAINTFRSSSKPV